MVLTRQSVSHCFIAFWCLSSTNTKVPLTPAFLLLEAAFLWVKNCSVTGTGELGLGVTELLLAHSLDTGTILRSINSDPRGSLLHRVIQS